jgi:hypothetical protein
LVTSQQQPHVLVSFYESSYKEKYDKKPIINRYRDKWGMKDVIDTVGFDRAKELITYYFKTTNPGHSMIWFLNNFDELDRSLSEKEKDRDLRMRLREQTKKMIEERESNEH